MRDGARILGLDPGLQNTGWGVIEVQGNRLIHIANGTVKSTAKRPLPERLVELHDGITAVIREWGVTEAAVEETFVNKNPSSTLKLGIARGMALLAPAQAGVPVAEYTPNLVKKSIVGAGHADKAQIQMMVKTLLPGVELNSPDAADALAVAICHAHHASFCDKVAI